MAVAVTVAVALGRLHLFPHPPEKSQASVHMELGGSMERELGLGGQSCKQRLEPVSRLLQEACFSHLWNATKIS